MRCFVALEVDEHCRKNLWDAIVKIREVAGEQKWVKPENLHLTLKFIGNLNKRQLPAVCEGLKSVCEQTAPFVMEVGGIGSFPSKGRPKIVFASVSEASGELQKLGEWVDEELAGRADVKRERRAFVPHITLCRVKGKSTCPTAVGLSKALGENYFGSVSVDEMVLMQSSLRASGPQYSVLERFQLKG